MPFPKGLAILGSCSFLPFGNKRSICCGFVLVFKDKPKSGFLWYMSASFNGWLSFVVNIVWAKESMSDPRVTQGEPLTQKVV